MDYDRVHRAVRRIAAREGVEESEIVNQINELIREAYETSLMEGNILALECWRRIPSKGLLPDAYELITYMAGILKLLDP